MKTNEVYAVFESSGHYDGTPKIIEVFTSEEKANDFLESERAKRREERIQKERNNWREKNLRKRKVENMLSDEEIEKKVEKFIKTIDDVLFFAIKVDTLEKVLDKIRDEIHDTYASMDESY